MKHRVRLTESDINRIVRESVNNTINEMNSTTNLSRKIQYILTEIQSGRLRNLEKIVQELHELQMEADYYVPNDNYYQK